MIKRNYIVKCNNGTQYDVFANCLSHARLRAYFKYKHSNGKLSRKEFDATIESVELKNAQKIK